MNDDKLSLIAPDTYNAMDLLGLAMRLQGAKVDGMDTERGTVTFELLHGGSIKVELRAGSTFELVNGEMVKVEPGEGESA